MIVIWLTVVVAIAARVAVVNLLLAATLETAVMVVRSVRFGAGDTPAAPAPGTCMAFPTSAAVNNPWGLEPVVQVRVFMVAVMAQVVQYKVDTCASALAPNV